ncbi:MAG: peptide deformylase [Clostridia bacterium]|nr:peptide deformylase [Clostridia bacterium]
MAILNIITEEDPLLRKKSREVTEITPRIIALLDDMRDTLHKAQGAGLAGVQVGVLRRIALVEYEEGNTIELINPEIIEVNGEQTGLEGCLSLPGKWGVVTRPETVTVRAMNRNGEIVTHTASGLGARAFCHEIEHMDGIIYTDRAERMLTPDEIEEMFEE